MTVNKKNNINKSTKRNFTILINLNKKKKTKKKQQKRKHTKKKRKQKWHWCIIHNVGLILKILLDQCHTKRMLK